MNRPCDIGKATFLVTVTTTEPPPNWGEHTLHKLTRELELMYGPRATIEHVKEWDTPSVQQSGPLTAAYQKDREA